jgi:hypothetical protein
MPNRAILALLLFLSLTPGNARAGCFVQTAQFVMQAPSIETVFRGRVLEIVRTADLGYRATFDVDRVWKGSVSPRVDLYVSERAAEMPRFEQGRQYVALASRLTELATRRDAGLGESDATVFAPTTCSGALAPDIAGRLGPGHPPTAADNSLRARAKAEDGRAQTSMFVDYSGYSVAELAARADFIIQGRVLNVRSHLISDETAVVTDYTIEPLRTLKRVEHALPTLWPGAPTSVTVRNVGGTVMEDGLTMATHANSTPAQETFSVGDEIVSFLVFERTQQVFYFADGPSAVFRVRDGQVLSQNKDDRERLGDRPVPLEAFLAGVQAHVEALEKLTPREHMIDLLNATVVAPEGLAPKSKGFSPTVPITIASDSPKTPTPIRVFAPQFQRFLYQLEDFVIFDLVLENVGSEVIHFPTLSAGTSVERDMPGAAVASVALRFEDPVGGSQTMGLHLLYGASRLPGSLIAIEPHQRVRIRARSTWHYPTAPTPRERHWPRELLLKATVTLTGNGGLKWAGESETMSKVQLVIPNRR